jgi:hypothetical protein
MTDSALHIERWHIPLGDVLSLHLDNADMARLVEARVVGNNLVIDMEGEPHARVERPVASPRPAAEPDERSSEIAAPAVLGSGSVEDSDLPEQAVVQPVEPAPEPELNGGALARQAAIICQEGAFRFYLQETMGVKEGDAAALLYRYLNITSRRLIDHDPHVAQRWRDLKREYDLWMMT